MESYIEKFGERLKLIRMEKNSGHPGEPRNRGIAIAQGEYIYCLDSDDIITETALEEMYTLAKEYDADVVYCERYFKSEGFGKEFKDNIRITDSRIQRPPFVEEPTLETDDLAERVKNLLNWRYWMSPALRLVKRDLLIENGIKFPSLVGSEDDVWSMEVLFCSKRFLRIPNICFVRRIHKDGISFGEYTTPDHVQRWMDVTIRSLKDLDNFMQRIDFFRENPSYRYDVLTRSIKGSFTNIFDKCKDKSSFDIYNIFQEKFGSYLGENDVLVSALCSYLISQRKELLEEQKKSTQKNQQLISKQEEENKKLKAKITSMQSLITLRLTAPKISVIIPLYNAEEYVAECLDSLLAQTFKDFEVIVVDDCSTDGSLTIVENYAPKFNGRLIITKTEVNSKGGGYVPRNIGFNLARGKYVFFSDADDHLLDTALETLYNAAEKYDTDVVYLAIRYTYWKPGNPSITRDGRGTELLAKGLEDKVTLTVDDPDENLHMLIQEKGFTTPWAHFVKRSFLIDNKIAFPEIPKAGDYIWAIHVYSYAKRFLRLPTPLYFYRRYNLNSVSKRSNSEQFSNWVLSFIAFAKALGELSNKSEILRDNISYSYEASSLYFDWCINRTNQARENLSNQDIFEVLSREFNSENDLSDLSIPFLFSIIDNAKKNSESHLQAIDSLKRRFASNNVSSKILTNCPAVSIIIPLYNAEKYIGELLDSILAQTFQDFEVIVVDDCSTDNSAFIVEIYTSKFDGRLRLAKTERNSGSPGEPGNIGVDLSRGEYLLILDNDDTITPDALEKLYATAKDFKADVVICEKFYWIPEESWYDEEFRKNLKPLSYQKGDFVKEPTLVPFDIVKRVQDCYDHKFLWSLWQKLIRRDFLVENKIRFTNNIFQDMLATCCLVYTAKRLVRVPYIINFYRVSKKSLYRRNREPLEQLKLYLRVLNVGFGYLNEFLNRKDIFQTNPASKQLALKTYFQEVWDLYILKIFEEVPLAEREKTLREEFAGTENTA